MSAHTHKHTRGSERERLCLFLDISTNIHTRIQFGERFMVCRAYGMEILVKCSSIACIRANSSVLSGPEFCNINEHTNRNALGETIEVPRRSRRRQKEREREKETEK